MFFLVVCLYGFVLVIEVGGVIGLCIDFCIVFVIWLELWGFQEVDFMSVGLICCMRLDLWWIVKMEESWMECWFGWLCGNGLVLVDVG